ncbi:MAG: hypothetical protein R3B09_11910 [Nannocystaceae bacterium]
MRTPLVLCPSSTDPPSGHGAPHPASSPRPARTGPAGAQALVALALAAVTASGCVITIPNSGDGTASASDGDDDGVIPDDPGAATLGWVHQPNACGRAYGVIHRDGEAIVVGARDGAPWIARLGGGGEVIWQHTDTRAGAYFAIDVDPSAAAPGLVAVGRIRDGEVNRAILDVYDDGGGALASHDNLGGAGAGLFGVAAIDGRYVVTGVLAGFDVLLGAFDPVTAALTLWEAPAGLGEVSSVGFGLRPTDDGVIVCGRLSEGMSGRAWIARYDAEGAPVWEILGPDPGDGDYQECWSVALGPEGDPFTAESGSVEARLARYGGGDGALQWAKSELLTGTQAIDTTADGTLYVGGWSADPAADPFRAGNTGQRSGWLSAFNAAGTLLWRAHAAMPLSINALRVGDGFVTVVGDVDPESACPHAWVGRFSL